ncbi:Uncharacterised protein [Vibrio cholerae]|nr:Uncharacterised protein [Vibrio cholerae]
MAGFEWSKRSIRDLQIGFQFGLFHFHHGLTGIAHLLLAE